ncbi:monocarboxylate transporter 14-like [Panulirus ornatus]|uniref:monocarboxylate transporter 14-like n=1 Tax=Panulirus ornatus TaxID=150431 RepID=UPI003A87BC74
MSPSGANPSVDKPSEAQLLDRETGRDQSEGGLRADSEGGLRADSESGLRADSEGERQLEKDEEQQQQQQQEEEKQEARQEPAPPDGGWGWAVAGGVFLIALVVPMLSPSFGILFSSQLLDWHTSSTAVAVIFNAFMVVWKLTGVVVGALSREFGFRRVAMMGTLLTSVCLTLSAFATSPELLFIFFSLGCGLGTGLSCVGYLILAQYFRRRRGLANTCLMAGAALGYFLSPLLIRVLQVEYGCRGATIIIGAIVLHGFVGATFFHPVEWHMRHPRVRKPTGDLEVVSSLLPQTKVRESSCACTITRLEEHSWSAMAEDQTRFQPIPGCQQTMQYPQTLENSTKSFQSRSDQHLACRTPAASLAHACSSDIRTSSPFSERGTCSYTLWSTIKRVFRAILKDMRILKHPSSLIIALGSTFIVNGEASFIVMVPFAIQAEGHSLQTAAWCTSVAGICSFLTRLCVSALSDFPWFNMRLSYMAGIATMAISVIAFTLQTDVAWQAGMVGVWGCAVGVFYGLNNLLMTRIVSLRNLTSMYGAKNLMGALGFFSIGPLIGVIRDVSGSYAISMWVLSGIILTSFILWLFMPSAQAYDQRRRAKEAQTRDSFRAS